MKSQCMTRIIAVELDSVKYTHRIVPWSSHRFILKPHLICSIFYCVCVCVRLYVALQTLFAVTLKCFLLINVVLSAIVAVLNVGVSSTKKQNANNPFLYSRAASGWHSEKSKWLPRLYHCGCCMEMTFVEIHVFCWLIILCFCLSVIELYFKCNSFTCRDSGFTLERFWCRLWKRKKKKENGKNK